MLQYILRRFLLSLPALWLLLTTVFLLSRLLTGSPGEEQILQESGGFYRKGSTASHEKAYRNYLKRTGQNLPLFYFSVKSSAEPDTLHLVYPQPHRDFLKKLSWQYGNAEAVNRYYLNIKSLEQSLTLKQKENLRPYFEDIYSSTAPKNLMLAAASFPTFTFDSSANEKRAELKAAATNLIKGRQAYTYLLPSFQWHGTDNQYHIWFMRVLQGDMGTSLRDNQPVNRILYNAVANTWWLILISIVVAFAISFELSILFVMPQGKKLRKFLLPMLFIIDSIPHFLLALLLLVLLATPYFLQLFPTYGMGYHILSGGSWIQQLSIYLQYMALPAICLILSNIPYLTTLIHRSFSEEIRKDYARTAKAKGLSERQVVKKHLLRNTLLPTITILSEALPALVAGAIVIEKIFAIPGVGRLLIDAVIARDYPVIVAIVMVIAVFRVIVYLLADVCYSLADPRIKYAAL